VELGLLHKGKKYRLRVFEKGLLKRIFGLKVGEECIIRGFITYMLHQILLG
jgi:hypothetical protein